MGAAAASPDLQTKASGSSFYAAMRLLPKAERDAMFAIYAFSRMVDDIADEGYDSREERATASGRRVARGYRSRFMPAHRPPARSFWFRR